MKASGRFILTERITAQTSAPKARSKLLRQVGNHVGEVLHLFQSREHGEPVREFHEVFAVEDKGFRDCIHGHGGSKRQVLLMDSETLAEFGVAPGRVKENITTRGLPLGTLQLGERLRVGGALLEVTSPCIPCRQMEEIR